MSARSKSAGFTLLEMMVVVAIIGILSAMAVATYQGIGDRTAAQNASHDFYSTMGLARARAQERGSDVWVLIYPTYKKSPAALTGGNGAYFLFEDLDGNFLRGGGSIHWNNFVPQTSMVPTDNDRLIEIVYLDDSKGANAQFGVPAGKVFGAPFAAALTGFSTGNGCSFCDGAKGAIVFSAEGYARFIDKDGLQSSARLAGLGLRSKKEARVGYLFGLVSATSFMSSYK